MRSFHDMIYIYRNMFSLSVSRIIEFHSKYTVWVFNFVSCYKYLVFLIFKVDVMHHSLSSYKDFPLCLYKSMRTSPL